MRKPHGAKVRWMKKNMGGKMHYRTVQETGKSVPKLNQKREEDPNIAVRSRFYELHRHLKRNVRKVFSNLA